MKKLLLSVFLLIPFFIFAQQKNIYRGWENVAGLSSSQSDSNFLKVGQEKQEKMDSALTQLKNDIDAFFLTIPKDGKVSYREMKTLKKLVKKFNSIRSSYDKKLKFFGLSTTVRLEPTILKHLLVYFTGAFIYSDNEEQFIRKFWIERSGRDVIVEKRQYIPPRIAIGLIFGFFIGLGVIGLMMSVGVENKNILIITFISVMSVMTLWIILA